MAEEECTMVMTKTVRQYRFTSAVELVFRCPVVDMEPWLINSKEFTALDTAWVFSVKRSRTEVPHKHRFEVLLQRLREDEASEFKFDCCLTALVDDKGTRRLKLARACIPIPRAFGVFMDRIELTWSQVESLLDAKGALRFRVDLLFDNPERLSSVVWKLGSKKQIQGVCSTKA